MRLFTLIAISTLMVFLFPSIASGQYRDTTETSMMTYRKGHLELQGSKLSNEEVRMLVGEDYSKYCRGRKQRIAGCILTPIGACTLGASLYLSYVGLITTMFGKPVPLYAGIALNAFGGAAFWPPASPPCGAAAATSRKSPPGTIAERRAPKSHSGQQETESASPSGSRDLWHSGYILLARKKSTHIYISFPIYIENSYICG